MDSLFDSHFVLEVTVFDLYAVSKSFDPQEYDEYLIEEGLTEEELESQIRYWQGHIDGRKYSLISERSN